MSSRSFVRSSKFRHVHGEAARKDKCYLNVNAATNGDGDFIKGNSKFIAFAGSGGGGPVAIIRRDNIIKLSHTVPSLNVHKTKVMDFAFSPFMSNMIATGAEDGQLKVSIIPEEGLTDNQDVAVATMEGHQKKISWVNFSPTVNSLIASSSYDQTVRVWDIQNQVEVCEYSLPENVQSFVWKGDGSQIVVSTKDKKVRIYDPRQSAAAVVADGPVGAKPARVVYFDGHDKFGCVGFSATSARQIMIYDARNPANPVTTDLDQSAGALSPYFDPDNSILYLAGKGDGNIRYFELVDNELFYLTEFRSNDSQRGVTFLPKTACDVTVCEIAVGLRLMRDHIQPVSFQVPRKSDLFQEDIFPNTYAGIPSMEVAEWKSGQNKPPVTTSMNPALRTQSASVAHPKPTFRSVADLERELAEANEKIKRLEAELATYRKQ